ncbi:MAG TPA: anaerobic sulfatase-maturation protein [Candidatus Hydrogenedentes bacterium]|nr:anaerobic sulfatase-maturation protein [Candidatus Hydrogenedentota bacterium]
MMAAEPQTLPSFHIMAKPTGPICNLDCKYCFYLEKENLYPDRADWAMSPEALESFIRQYIASQRTPEVIFAWQGGEPTLLGLDFFRRAVALQEQYADGKRISNSFQTNGVLLNDAWCEFFAENRVLVGLSIDGPEKLHDRYRVDKGQHPTFKRVMRGIECMKKHGVEFNTLTCVQRHNSHHPLEVYRFLKEAGSGFMQFIPIVERRAPEPGSDGLSLVTPDHAAAQVTEWSVEPLQYGKFLAAIFDEWVRNDVGKYFVQIVDVTLPAWLGMDPALCVFRTTCGDAMALESNGDLYACDHFVYPEYRLGNIVEEGIEKLANSEAQRRFGQDKQDTLPRYCRECPVHFVCHGECPKHRFLATPDGEPGLNYLCEGYKHFFRHIDPYMRFMANELRMNRPAANVMRWVRVRDLEAEGKTAPGPNEPCICGSGRKYKKCCGRRGP